MKKFAKTLQTYFYAFISVISYKEIVAMCIVATIGCIIYAYDFNALNPYVAEDAKVEKQVVHKKDTGLVSDYLLNKLIKYRAPNPYVALAQFKIESGRFTSKLFIENNNPMGMKYPSRRPTTASKVLNGYAYYDTLNDAVLDYILYSLYNTKGTLKDEEYINTVLGNYAEDSSYKVKVTNLSVKLKKHGVNK